VFEGGGEENTITTLFVRETVKWNEQIRT
jgi:hypothetical protein